MVIYRVLVHDEFWRSSMDISIRWLYDQFIHTHLQAMLVYIHDETAYVF